MYRSHCLRNPKVLCAEKFNKQKAWPVFFSFLFKNMKWGGKRKRKHEGDKKPMCVEERSGEKNCSVKVWDRRRCMPAYEEGRREGGRQDAERERQAYNDQRRRSCQSVWGQLKKCSKSKGELGKSHRKKFTKTSSRQQPPSSKLLLHWQGRKGICPLPAQSREDIQNFQWGSVLIHTCLRK